MRYIVSPEARLSTIKREVYGSFSEHLGRCIYNGMFVGKDSKIPNTNGMRNDLVDALRNIKLPVMRWPGGCFADEYHWLDGIGKLESRKKMINTHWGGVVEDNSFGTHEFFELCRQIGCEPYVNGNVGSGSVSEMQEWVEYMTSPAISPMANMRRANGKDEPWELKYFAVGNENWGCGGNMTADFYADNYRRYQTYVRNYTSKRIYKIACGPGTSPTDPNYGWTRTLMEKAAGMMDGLSLHYYTITGNWANKGSATEFTKEEYYTTLANAYYIDALIRNHDGIMSLYDPEKKIGLIVDEWGTWFNVEPGTNPGFLFQQNTMRDAMVAGITFNSFNKHSDRVHMANIAQTVNVLQSLILTDGDKMLLTPTYHIFDMWKEHQGAELVSSTLTLDESGYFTSCGIKTPCVSESASVSADGSLNITLCNLSASESAPIELRADSFIAGDIDARILCGKIDSHNTFDFPEGIKPESFSSFTLENTTRGSEISFTLPPCSALSLKLVK